MATTSAFYGLGMKAIACGTVDLQGDLFGMLLYSNGYTPDVDNHRWRSDVTSEVIGTSGYTVGGATLSQNTVSYDSSTNETRWTFNSPVQWGSGSAFTAYGAVIYRRNGGTSSADELVQYVDFGGAFTVSGGTFSYTVPATGDAAITT